MTDRVDHKTLQRAGLDPDIVRAWLPMSLPKKRSLIPSYLTHALVLRLLRDSQVFLQTYEGADRRIVVGLYDVAMGSDDYWNVLAEALELRLCGELP